MWDQVEDNVISCCFVIYIYILLNTLIYTLSNGYLFVLFSLEMRDISNNLGAASVR